MQTHRFFGFGSLVNAETHIYTETQPATLIGWQRVWVHTEGRPLAFLSAQPGPGEIDGLTAAVPNGDWVALDHRETGYRPHPVTTKEGQAVQIYAVPQTGQIANPHPILLSYLDVVVQGYANVFGEAGVQKFFATTRGWHSPILDDRHAPQYPRAQVLTPAERALTDTHLAQAQLNAARETGSSS